MELTAAIESRFERVSTTRRLESGLGFLERDLAEPTTPWPDVDYRNIEIKKLGRAKRGATDLATQANAAEAQSLLLRRAMEEVPNLPSGGHLIWRNKPEFFSEWNFYTSEWELMLYARAVVVPERA